MQYFILFYWTYVQYRISHAYMALTLNDVMPLVRMCDVKKVTDSFVSIPGIASRLLDEKACTV